jgi:ADP-ribose pyrophosphatase YjhB (NUDIX family)
MDSSNLEPAWLAWGRRIHALAQSGIAFTKNPFDIQRYEELKKIAAEMLAGFSAHSAQRIESLFNEDQGYATPKLDVRAAVFRGPSILMVRERRTGGWTLPGGFMDVNQTPSEAAEAEVLDEASITARAVKVAAIYDRRKHEYRPGAHHFYKIYMLCELISGEPKPGLETTGAQFFTADELRTLELDTYRVTLRHVLRMFEHAANPALPTDFD